MDQQITFESEGNLIEGCLQRGSTGKGVVVTHPHPLYGGDMHNPVVISICSVYSRQGFTTLRFNFRGVGNSRGRYANGIGEQQDVIAAMDCLANVGIQEIDLAGYSFGAWVNAFLGCGDADIANMLMISPPVAFVDFSAISEISCLKLIVTGSRDDIAPADMIKKSLPKWNRAARLEIINDADHFYGDFLPELEAILAAAI